MKTTKQHPARRDTKQEKRLLSEIEEQPPFCDQRDTHRIKKNVFPAIFEPLFLFTRTGGLEEFEERYLHSSPHIIKNIITDRRTYRSHRRFSHHGLDRYFCFDDRVFFVFFFFLFFETFREIEIAAEEVFHRPTEIIIIIVLEVVFVSVLVRAERSTQKDEDVSVDAEILDAVDDKSSGKNSNGVSIAKVNGSSSSSEATFRSLRDGELDEDNMIDTVQVVTVRFQIKMEVGFGDVMRICGSHESMGEWDVANALLLNWSEGTLGRAKRSSYRWMVFIFTSTAWRRRPIRTRRRVGSLGITRCCRYPRRMDQFYT